MTRGEIKTRVQKRTSRSDSTTTSQIEDWIDEVIRVVEQSYPLSYTKKSQTSTITADNKTFTLPSTLILHHKFSMLLESVGSSELTYTYLIKTADGNFDLNFTKPNSTADGPDYWVLRGGTNGLNFDVYPVPNQDRTIKLGSGYFYSGAFTLDSESTWLTNNYPDLVIEGVAAKAFEHYSEPTKADRAYSLFQTFLGGDLKGVIEAEKDMQQKGRMLRVKTLDDIPSNIAIKQRRFGY